MSAAPALVVTPLVTVEPGTLVPTPARYGG